MRSKTIEDDVILLEVCILEQGTCSLDERQISTACGDLPPNEFTTCTSIFCAVLAKLARIRALLVVRDEIVRVMSGEAVSEATGAVSQAVFAKLALIRAFLAGSGGATCTVHSLSVCGADAFRSLLLNR